MIWGSTSGTKCPATARLDDDRHLAAKQRQDADALPHSWAKSRISGHPPRARLRRPGLTTQTKTRTTRWHSSGGLWRGDARLRGIPALVYYLRINAGLVHEKELQQKLQRGENLPSVCDWVFSSGNHVLAIEANNRVLHHPFAERTRTVEEFRTIWGTT